MVKNFIGTKRIQKGLTILELAEKSKLPTPVVMLIEAGYLMPCAEFRTMLAKALRTGPEKLFPEIWVVPITSIRE